MAFFELTDDIALYQWDSGVTLTINGELGDEQFVHFTIPNTDEIYSLHPVGGVVEIPSQILQKSGIFTVYAFVVNESGDKTLVSEQFYILARPMPPEYIDDPTPVITYPELVQLVDDMDTLKAETEGLVADMETLQTKLSTWTATIDNTTGTPTVSVTMDDSGTHLAFTHLKGAKGAKGDKGDKGDVGVPTVTYDATNKRLTIVYS